MPLSCSRVCYCFGQVVLVFTSSITPSSLYCSLFVDMFTSSILPAATALGFLAGHAVANSKLFDGATIIAFDSASESLKVVRDGALLVTDDRIAGIYDTKPSNDSLPANTECIDVTGQIITPGFIDTHRHGMWMETFPLTLTSHVKQC